MATHHHTVDLRHIHWSQHRLLLGVIALLVLGSIILFASVARPGAQVGSYGANLSASAILAEQARLDFRQGEWGSLTVAPAVLAAYAEKTRLDFRRGEWASPVVAPEVLAAFAERARLDFRRGEWDGGQAVRAEAAEQARLDFRRGEWSGQ